MPLRGMQLCPMLWPRHHPPRPEAIEEEDERETGVEVGWALL